MVPQNPELRGVSSTYTLSMAWALITFLLFSFGFWRKRPALRSPRPPETNEVNFNSNFRNFGWSELMMHSSPKVNSGRDWAEAALEAVVLVHRRLEKIGGIGMGMLRRLQRLLRLHFSCHWVLALGCRSRDAVNCKPNALSLQFPVFQFLNSLVSW